MITQDNWRRQLDIILLGVRSHGTGSLGRFLSVDPLIAHPGSTQSINPYSYVANNPLNKIDPTGEETTCSENGSSGSTCGGGNAESSMCSNSAYCESASSVTIVGNSGSQHISAGGSHPSQQKSGETTSQTTGTHSSGPVNDTENGQHEDLGTKDKGKGKGKGKDSANDKQTPKYGGFFGISAKDAKGIMENPTVQNQEVTGRAMVEVDTQAQQLSDAANGPIREDQQQYNQIYYDKLVVSFGTNVTIYSTYLIAPGGADAVEPLAERGIEWGAEHGAELGRTCFLCGALMTHQPQFLHQGPPVYGPTMDMVNDLRRWSMTQWQILTRTLPGGD